MSKYIEIISKIKPKNQQSFKIADITDIQVNLNADSKVLYVQGDTLASSGIAWQSAEQYCNIDGDLHINGSLYENSDVNLKKNIIRIHSSLQVLSKIEGVSFNWKQTNRKDYGVIAQQLESILPQTVSLNNKTGHKQVAYIKLIPFLIQAIKELNKRIETLEFQRSKRVTIKNIFMSVCKYLSQKLKLASN